jgi:hypothetical protein
MPSNFLRMYLAVSLNARNGEPVGPPGEILTGALRRIVERVETC